MNRVEFGRLIAALRKEHRDEDDRVWTQWRLGEETRLGKEAISKIEQGRKAVLDRDTLVSLAEALKLTSAERQQFYLAGMGIDDRHLVREERKPEEVFDELMHILEDASLPAFIIDSYGDFVAANLGMLGFIGISPEEALTCTADLPAGFSLMRVLYGSGDFTDFFGDHGNHVARSNMQFFRSITLRQRFTEYFKVCFRELRRYPLFKQYWQQAAFEEDGDFSISCQRYRWQHRILGPLDYLSTMAAALTTSGELYLVMYVPLDSATANIFAKFVSKGGTKAYRLAPWPKKKLPDSALRHCPQREETQRSKVPLLFPA
jgi:PAS domain-containing protein